MQVKGLEFDYVVILDATGSAYPDTTEARHLLHIAITRRRAPARMTVPPLARPSGSPWAYKRHPIVCYGLDHVRIFSAPRV